MTSFWKIVTSFAVFSIYDQFGAIRKPDFGCRVCKNYIFINSSLLS